MSNEQATILGVVSFSAAMQERLDECAKQGKANWHMPGSIDPSNNTENEIERFRQSMQVAMNEKRMVDVANYAMMIYHRERMEND